MYGRLHFLHVILETQSLSTAMLPKHSFNLHSRESESAVSFHANHSLLRRVIFAIESGCNTKPKSYTHSAERAGVQSVARQIVQENGSSYVHCIGTLRTNNAVYKKPNTSIFTFSTRLIKKKLSRNAYHLV